METSPDLSMAAYFPFQQPTITSKPIMKITSAIITPMPEVIATFENGSSKSLFTFYPDEISFRESEFVSLTEEEAHSLFQQKNTAYLCS